VTLESNKMGSSKEDRAPSLRRLVKLGLPAMAMEAAPFACVAVQTGIIAHSCPDDLSPVHLVASFAAVNSSLDFALGLFNFFFMVVLSNVGRAVGQKDWEEVGRRVRTALAAAVVLGIFAAGAISLLFPWISDLMHIQSGAGTTPTGVRTFFFFRASAVPALLILKVALGALGGFQKLGPLAALNIGRAVLEAGGAYAALCHYDVAGKGPGPFGWRLSAMGPLGVVGAVSAASAYTAALTGVALVFVMKPLQGSSEGRVPLCVPLCGRRALCGSLWSATQSKPPSSDHPPPLTVPLIPAAAAAPPGFAAERESPLVRTAAAASTTVVLAIESPCSSGDDGGGGGESIGGAGSGVSGDKGTGERSLTWRSLAKFYRDSRDTMVRSICLQSSVWALAVCASKLGTAALAAHQVLLLLWMLTSYVVDGFADVGTMVGAKLLGQRKHSDFVILTQRLAFLGVSVGCGAALIVFFSRDTIIHLLLGDGGEKRDDADANEDEKDKDEFDESVRLLNQAWPFFCLCQVSNSIVFTYDGLLLAAGQFAFTRNVFLLGTLLLYAPALVLGYAGFHTLLAVWAAKALLNFWRAATSVARISWWLPLKWAAADEAREDANARPISCLEDPAISLL